MNRITLGTMLATATLLVASCSTDKQGTTPVDGKKINLVLSTEGAAQLSRATPITTNVLPPNAEFSLSAFTIAGKAIYQDLNKKVLTANAAGNEVSDWGTYYWPIGDNLKFYAFYPTETTGAAKGTLSVTTDQTTPSMAMEYTVNKSFDQSDLLYAYSHNTSASGDVNLTFNHALTRLSFSCKVENAAAAAITSLKVTGIKFNKAVWKGVLTVGETGSAAWTPEIGSKADYLCDVTGTSAAELFKATPEFTNIFSTTDDSFLMIPVSQTDFGGSNLSTIEVTFKINDSQEKTGTIPLSTLSTDNASLGWPIGKHVNYQMTFNGTNATNLLVVDKISVVEWGAPIDVPVDIN